MGQVRPPFVFSFVSLARRVVPLVLLKVNRLARLLAANSAEKAGNEECSTGLLAFGQCPSKHIENL
jgi:hypothetical protein